MFRSWTTFRSIIITGLDYQIDIVSSPDINKPKYLIAVHQTEARKEVSNTAHSSAIFDHFDARKCFVEITLYNIRGRPLI